MRRLAGAAGAILIGWLGAAGSTAAAPAMWRVSDGDSDVYLFGTLHALKPSLKWRTPLYDEVLARAGTVWFLLAVTGIALAVTAASALGTEPFTRPGLVEALDNVSLVAVVTAAAWGAGVIGSWFGHGVALALAVWRPRRTPGRPAISAWRARRRSGRFRSLKRTPTLPAAPEWRLR